MLLEAFSFRTRRRAWSAECTFLAACARLESWSRLADLDGFEQVSCFLLSFDICQAVTMTDIDRPFGKPIRHFFWAPAGKIQLDQGMDPFTANVSGGKVSAFDDHGGTLHQSADAGDEIGDSFRRTPGSDSVFDDDASLAAEQSHIIRVEVKLSRLFALEGSHRRDFLAHQAGEIGRDELRQSDTTALRSDDHIGLGVLDTTGDLVAHQDKVWTLNCRGLGDEVGSVPPGLQDEVSVSQQNVVLLQDEFYVLRRQCAHFKITISENQQKASCS